MIKRIEFMLMIMAVVVTGGCTTAGRHEEPIIFPPAPERPRIVYLRSIWGELDVVKPGFFNNLFGTVESQDFKYPLGVSASDDKIYLADNASKVVFDIDTKKETFGYLGLNKFVAPSGVAAGADGMVYVTDGTQKQVYAYDAKTGAFRFSFGQGVFKSVAGIAVNDELGRLYVVDTWGGMIKVYNLEGKPLFQFGEDGLDDGMFHYPTNLAIERKTGDVYVTDTQNFRVQVFDKDGKFLRKWGSLGDLPGYFTRPKGIGVDSDGHVYVVDAAFNNIQIYNREGNQLLLILGGYGTRRGGEFQLPAGMYIDKNDRIYVADTMNRRIQIFQYLSERWRKDHPEEYKKYLPPGMEVEEEAASSEVKSAGGGNEVKPAAEGSREVKPAGGGNEVKPAAKASSEVKPAADEKPIN